jgi:hypothetical protein
VAARIDKKTSGFGGDILERDPNRRHPARGIRVEIVSILMRPGRGVSVEKHRLHDPTRLAQKRLGRPLDGTRGDGAQAGVAEMRQRAGREILDIEHRVHHEAAGAEAVPLEQAGGLPVKPAPIGPDVVDKGLDRGIRDFRGDCRTDHRIALTLVKARCVG